jgi:hypothetical protein
LLAARFAISVVQSLAHGVYDVRPDLLVLGLHFALEVLQSVLVLFEIYEVLTM